MQLSVCILITQSFQYHVLFPIISDTWPIFNNVVFLSCSCTILCSTTFCRLSNDSQRRITQSSHSIITNKVLHGNYHSQLIGMCRTSKGATTDSSETKIAIPSRNKGSTILQVHRGLWNALTTILTAMILCVDFVAAW